MTDFMFVSIQLTLLCVAFIAIPLMFVLFVADEVSRALAP
jgi:hypothetical protein